MKARWTCPTQGDLFAECNFPLTEVAIAVAATVKPQTANYLWPLDYEYPQSIDERLLASAAAVTTLASLAQHHTADLSDEQRQVLSKFSGWGGVTNALNSTRYWRYGEAGQALRSAVGEERFHEVEQASLTSYFTPPSVVRAMWDGVRKLGFTGGTVLDPASGSGAFIGMCPGDLIDRCKFTLVEKDPISADICKALYPDAKCHSSALEDVRLPENYFDLVIGNVPFGNFSVSDGEMRSFRGLIHDYFFLKALRKCREGGLIALITTAGSLDKQSGRVRHEIASQAKLLGAIRLPNSVFDSASASVTTDVIVLQKLPHHMCDADAAIWTQSCEWENSGLYINQYYLENPDAVLGQLEIESSRYGQGGLQCVGGAPSRVAITECFDRMPRLVKAAKRPVVGEQLMADETAPEGSVQLHDGVPHVVRNGMLERIVVNGRRAKRLVGLVGVRAAALDLIRGQVDCELTDTEVEAMRSGLNRVYTAFTAEFGALSSPACQTAFDEDPSYPLLLSLEIVDSENETVTKAPIFTERTAWARKPRTHADTLTDAALIALDQTGEVSVERVGALMGTDEGQTMQTLLADENYFLDPASSAVVPRDAYLSGDVRQKLHQALAAFDVDGKYEKNVAALQAALPSEISHEDIVARLGQGWIPKEYIEEFITWVSQRKVSVVHVPDAAYYQLADTRYAPTVGPDWGTGRVSFYSLVEKGLNQQVPDVYDTHPDGRRVINQDETIAARDRLDYIQEQFSQWLWSDETRRKRLGAIYNNTYNCFVDRVFDGNHLTFPGMSDVYEPRSNQRNAVWRGLQTGTMMLAHFVGSGKTLTLAATTMEKKRLGQWNKPLIAVQNSTLLQFTAEFLRVYPHARVLMMGRDDMTKEARKRFVAKIATHNWDAIIVPHSVFDRIAVYPETILAYVESLIAPLEDARDACSDGLERRVISQQIESLRTKIRGLANERNKDDTIYFEELGVDGLVIDEAQAYKNLYVHTKMTNVSGVNGTFSQRALNMLLKVRNVYERQQGNRGVIFSTATPICNSMSEVFAMQTYLQPKLLEEKGLACFDAWAAQFGQRISSLEITPEGSGFRSKERFARFHNVPELSRMVRQAWDVVLKGSVEAIKVPSIVGGKPSVVAVARTKHQAAYITELAERAEDVRKRRVKPSEDNMLKIVSEGRKVALDMRLIDPVAEDYTESKVNECIRRVFEIWARSAPERSTQIIFCDTSSPESTGFSVYHEIRRKLVDRGVPVSEIAFIHDFDTDKKRFGLLQRFNQGIVRILLGSTEKLGIGTNAQVKLLALHHLDVPWRPDMVEQRDGRAVRQGNENASVEINRYVTQGSFDAFMWQTVERKAQFIEQFLTGTVDERNAEDLSEVAMSYAEVKAIASGDPNVRELCLVQVELRRLYAVARSQRSVRAALEREQAYLPKKLEESKRALLDFESDAATVNANRNRQWKLSDGREGNKDAVAQVIMAWVSNSPFRDMVANHVYPLANLAGLSLNMCLDPAYDYKSRLFYLEGMRKYPIRMRLAMQPAELVEVVTQRMKHIAGYVSDEKAACTRIQRRIQELEDMSTLSTESPIESRISELEERETTLRGLVETVPA